MKAAFKIVLTALIIFCVDLFAQPVPIKIKGRWGIKDGDKVLIQPVFDTIFNFDEGRKVCLACAKQKAPANKIIRTNAVSWACNYLNPKQQKLTIKTNDNDTCTVFSFTKNSVKNYMDYQESIVVSVKGKMFLVSKDFRQLTFNDYHEISPSVDPLFYQVKIIDGSETALCGLIDRQEKIVIPYQYSHIRINPIDSLIMGCAAGVREGSDDDIFDYNGKRLESYRRHVEMATKTHIVHRVFEPKDHFVIYNINSKEEKNLNANEVHFFDHHEILIRIKDDWYVYDLNTHTKKPKQY